MVVKHITHNTLHIDTLTNKCKLHTLQNEQKIQSATPASYVPHTMNITHENWNFLFENSKNIIVVCTIKNNFFHSILYKVSLKLLIHYFTPYLNVFLPKIVNLYPIAQTPANAIDSVRWQRPKGGANYLAKFQTSCFWLAVSRPIRFSPDSRSIIGSNFDTPRVMSI